MPMEHYRLRFEEAKVPDAKMMATAAVRSCCSCGVCISALGGGGRWICGPCLQHLLSGHFHTCFEIAGGGSNEGEA